MQLFMKSSVVCVVLSFTRKRQLTTGDLWVVERFSVLVHACDAKFQQRSKALNQNFLVYLKQII